MKTGIVILNYNDAASTRKLLDTVSGFCAPDFIAVVDNNSSDDSCSVLKEYESGRIFVLASDKNGGYGAGNNLGIRFLAEKGAELVVVSNSDVIFTESDILKLFSDFDDDEIAAVAPRIMEGGRLNRGWKFPGAVLDAFISLNGVGRLFARRLKYPDSFYDTDMKHVDAVSGCFFIVRTDAFLQAGGFDEGVFLYYEEYILSKRIAPLGKKIMIDNRVTIVHEHSVTIDKSYKKVQKFEILLRSKMYYHKHYGGAGALKRALLSATGRLALAASRVIALGRAR